MSTLPIGGVEGVPLTPARPEPKPVAGASFQSALDEMVNKVEALQVNADQEATKVAQGGGNLHETALALEKADVAMRLAVKVRNKLVDAYNEVMRMSV